MGCTCLQSLGTFNLRQGEELMCLLLCLCLSEQDVLCFTASFVVTRFPTENQHACCWHLSRKLNPTFQCYLGFHIPAHHCIISPPTHSFSSHKVHLAKIQSLSEYLVREMLSSDQIEIRQLICLKIMGKGGGN